ncbi:MAG: cytochrome bc complex cytochrome b subunit [Acidimicrobiaceae bacterium]|nr:cytochrome bc complex cytochrome b subunit [Acidimicrobiaceae bacterium]
MPGPVLRKANRFVDERVGSQSFLKEALDHIFPDHWSFMFGEIAFYFFVLLVASGVFLTVFFDPSDTVVVYHGSYAPLRGVSMPDAYKSAVQLSFDVRAGLFFRQLHHWAANLFVAAIVCHACRLFFTGAFRKPRDINWMVGVILLWLSIFNGFTGYSLLDDLLSGTGLRIAYTVVQSVPVVGNWLAFLAFGGQYPSDQVTHRLFISHVLVVPGIIAALLAVHLSLIWRQKHTQFPGPGRTERRIVGSPLWPTYVARSTGLFFAVLGVASLLGGLAQINPIWLYGPYLPQNASALSQPDWYLGWLIGALRLFPAWRLSIFGYTVSEVFWPALVLPMLTVALMLAYPWLERLVTRDRAVHNLLDQPRHRPGRTGLGVGIITFFIVLEIAGAQDLFAHWMGTTQPPVTLVLRGLVVGLPIAAGVLAAKLSRDLSRTGRSALAEPPIGEVAVATPPTTRYLPPPAVHADGAPIRRGIAVGAAAGLWRRAGRLARWSWRSDAGHSEGDR